MRIMDLENWPPRVGWMVNSNRGNVVSLSPQQVTIERVVRVLATYIIFTCTFECRSVYYELQLDEPKRTERVAEILRANVGMSLESIEAVEIDSHTDQKIAS